VSEHPVTATLRRSGRCSHRGCWLGAFAGPRSGPGWLALGALGRDDHGIDAILAQVGRDAGSDRRDVQASLFLESLAWAVLLPLAGALIVDRRALHLAGASVRIAAHGRASAVALLPGRFGAVRDDECAGHPDAEPVGTEDDLAAILRGQVLDDFEPVIGRVCARSGRSERALWRSVGDRAATAFLFAGEATGRRPAAERLAGRLLRGPEPLQCRPRYVLIDGPDGPMRAHARRGCCLWWRARAAAPCLTCPLDARARA
jgi:hypothetical protein